MTNFVCDKINKLLNNMLESLKELLALKEKT